MAEEGKTTQELKAIIERRRATVVATLCGAIEESTLLRHDQNKLKHLVREVVSRFADGIAAMLPSVVDEDIPVNVLYLEFVERYAADIADLVTARVMERIDHAIPAAQAG